MSTNVPVATSARAGERRARAALRMRTGEKWIDDEGKVHLDIYTWSEITDILGFSDEVECRNAVERMLERDLQDDPNSKGRMREMAARRFEQLLRATWQKANNPDHEEHLAAVGRAESLVDKFVKLYGLAAPQEFINHNPAQSEMQQWVAEVMSQKNGNVEEDDIFAMPALPPAPEDA